MRIRGAMLGMGRAAAGLAAGLAALLLAACALPERAAERAAAEDEAPRGVPAMWRVADADTTLYLFGTIHLLPEGVEWRTPGFEAAFTAADELVVEVALGADPGAAAQTMMAMGLAEGLPPLAERVPEEHRPMLRRAIAESGLPEAVLDRMRTWTAGLALAAATFQRLGLQGGLGVDQGLTRSAGEADKPVVGLETIEEQFGFFAGLSEESQRAFLIAAAQESGDVEAQFRAMLDAWLLGDKAAIARTFDSELLAHPELYGVLMTERNRRWAEWLAGRLDRPGTVFVAVGAGHLAGRDSVQDMLRARGLKVERVQ